MTPAHQTLQQRRASHAWDRVEEIAKKPDDLRKKYGSLVRGLPALVLSDGLGQALAFLLAKAGGKTDKEHYHVYQHIMAWAQVQLGVPKDDDLLGWLLKQNSTEYRRTTTEILSYLTWLKRFSEAKGWKDAEKDADR